MIKRPVLCGFEKGLPNLVAVPCAICETQVWRGEDVVRGAADSLEEAIASIELVDNVEVTDELIPVCINCARTMHGSVEVINTWRKSRENQS